VQQLIPASLIDKIKTPPPSLLRAWFATALDHLPSVPSVVLPIQSLAEKPGFPAFKRDIY
jgi:hypothetical protein